MPPKEQNPKNVTWSIPSLGVTIREGRVFSSENAVKSHVTSVPAFVTSGIGMIPAILLYK